MLAVHLGEAATPEHLQALGDRAWVVREAAMAHLEAAGWEADPDILEAADLASRERWDAVLAIGAAATPPRGVRELHGPTCVQTP